jgi:adenylate cyclase
MGEISRRLAGILAADVVGYTRLLGADEAGTLDLLRAMRRDVVDPLVAKHGGRVFKTTGDGLLMEFASAVEALRCAIAVQERQSEVGGLQLRIGVHQGDVVVQGDDLLGEGVNIAARIEPLAEPGGIAISARVHEDAAGKVPLIVEDLGTPELKNVAQVIRVFRVRLGTSERPTLPLPEKPSLAVLPFQNMSGDPEQEYFADGMVDDITAALSRIGELFVIARNSSFTYKGHAVDVKKVGRELGVRYVLEGSVRKAARRVRINCQLIDASNGAHVWADTFDSELDDIFDLQDRVTESVAGAIGPTLRNLEIQRALTKPTGSLDAYDLYLRALYHFDRFTPEDFAKASDLLRQATELVPRFARAKALWAYVIGAGMTKFWYPRERERVAQALALARAALADANDDPETLRMAGRGVAYLGGDVAAGRMALDRAMILNPNSARVLTASGWLHMYAAQWETARDEFRRALRLSPLDPEIYFGLVGLGTSLMELGQGEEAVQHLRRALSTRHGDQFGWSHLIHCLVQLGRIDEAREEARKLMDQRPRITLAFFREDMKHWPAAYQERRLVALRAAGFPE